MATSRNLYAWAVPMIGPGAHWDHTWVTSYDNRAHPYRDTAAVELAGQDYWYCWGGFHQRGGTPSLADGLLGFQAGEYDAARCLAGSNVDCSVNFAARGTIFAYGVDGICHQLANQVLYATALDGAEPLTVSQANGYWVSCGIYGAYGLQHSAWRNKIAICATLEAPSPSTARGRKMSDGADPGLRDEFEDHVGKVLGADDASRLLVLRARFQNDAAAHAHIKAALTAHELNARNQRFLDDAAKLLSAADFNAIFGIKPGTKINLVLSDPSK